MTRMLLSVAAPALVTLAFGGTAPVRVVASVRPCQIVVSAARTQSLHPGAYTFVVRDTSRSRYFSLVGPGVNRRTRLAYVGTTTWRMRLIRGTYRFRCGRVESLGGRLVVV